MANICIYKILVKGTKQACEAFVAMMPSYSEGGDIWEESGTDADYTLAFSGDCKWSVDSYCAPLSDPQPWTPARIQQAIESTDSSDWYYTIRDKSILLNCEVFCNSKDIDSNTWACYEHYNKGERIFDECPKELHIKRGRDYDQWLNNYSNTAPSVNYDAPSCKVRFSDGKSYWYQGTYTHGDLVYVEGAKSGILGMVIEVSDTNKNGATQNVVSHIGNAAPFVPDVFEEKWKAHKPAERKLWLEKMSLKPEMTKKQFLTAMENTWIEEAGKGCSWNTFVRKVSNIKIS